MQVRCCSTTKAALPSAEDPELGSGGWAAALSRLSPSFIWHMRNALTGPRLSISPETRATVRPR